MQELQECQAISRTPFLTGWIYHPDRGWIYTDTEIFPYLYLESTGNWLLHEIGSAEPHYFFDYNENNWQSWQNNPSTQLYHFTKLAALLKTPDHFYVGRFFDLVSNRNESFLLS
jgi:hypothetical protein